MGGEMTTTTEQLKDLLAMGEAGYSGAWDHMEKMAPTLADEVVQLRSALGLIADMCDDPVMRTVARQALDATGDDA